MEVKALYSLPNTACKEMRSQVSRLFPLHHKIGLCIYNMVKMQAADLSTVWLSVCCSQLYVCDMHSPVLC